MLIALTSIFFLIAVLLVVIVLIQPGSPGGMGFFGGGSQSAFGAKTGNVLTKFTTLLAALFLMISLTLGYLNSRQSKIQTKEMLNIKETVKESPEEKPSGPSSNEDIGVDITDKNKK
jgi:preprotein translocase subunit SecG